MLSCHCIGFITYNNLGNRGLLANAFSALQCVDCQKYSKYINRKATETKEKLQPPPEPRFCHVENPLELTCTAEGAREVVSGVYKSVLLPSWRRKVIYREVSSPCICPSTQFGPCLEIFEVLGIKNLGIPGCRLSAPYNICAQTSSRAPFKPCEFGPKVYCERLLECLAREKPAFRAFSISRKF